MRRRRTIVLHLEVIVEQIAELELKIAQALGEAPRWRDFRAFLLSPDAVIWAATLLSEIGDCRALSPSATRSWPTAVRHLSPFESGTREGANSAGPATGVCATRSAHRRSTSAAGTRRRHGYGAIRTCLGRFGTSSFHLAPRVRGRPRAVGHAAGFSRNHTTKSAGTSSPTPHSWSRIGEERVPAHTQHERTARCAASSQCGPPRAAPVHAIGEGTRWSRRSRPRRAESSLGRIRRRLVGAPAGGSQRSALEQPRSNHRTIVPCIKPHAS